MVRVKLLTVLACCAVCAVVLVAVTAPLSQQRSALPPPMRVPPPPGANGKDAVLQWEPPAKQQQLCAAGADDAAVDTWPWGARGALSYTFDDGVDSLFSIPPLLSRYGVRGSFYLNIEELDKNPTKKAACANSRWRKAADALALGHEIGGHSGKHEHMADVKIAWAKPHLHAADSRLKSGLGLNESYKLSFAYPYGNSDSRPLRKFTAENYIASRGSFSRTDWHVESYSPRHMEHLGNALQLL
eukprot:TRINITY_DN5079_c0_g1_i1.p2 TRINITY_DN5079_c0_g1~~TRINITY_DN5079_c0_g1_i1.p2  ORF type:complete len:243 (-),score=52.44 TRINITY_DN5079_c0_g1_i1:631-1359(-)